MKKQSHHKKSFFRFRNQSAFSILEVMIVAGLMSIVGLSITSVITNTTKSQKRIEQKDNQLSQVNYIRGLLQNPEFCINAFCTDTDAATCANLNITKLPPDATAPANMAVHAIQAKLTSGTAVNVLRCNQAASDGCNTHPVASFQPSSAPFGTPVPGVNGLYLYGMWLADLTYKGNSGAVHYSTARLLLQFATQTGSSTAPNLKSSSIELYFRGDNNGNITSCAAGAVDSKWLDSPGIPNAIYFTAGEVGIGIDNPIRTLHVVGTKTADGDSATQIRVEDDTGYNANPQSGIHFANRYNALNQTAGMGAVTVIKENSTDGDYSSSMRFHTRLNGSPLAENMRISSDGNVGIGTTTPRGRLDVNGATRLKAGTPGNDSAAVGAAFEDNGDTGLFMTNYTAGNPATGDLNLFTNATPRLTVTSAGDVGIQTTSPGAPLDVAGNILLSGAGTKSISTSAGSSLLLNAPGVSAITFMNNGSTKLNIASNGQATFANNITVNTGGVSVTAGGVNVSAGGITVSAGHLNLANGNNLTLLGGNLSVTGTANITGAATIPTLNGNISHNGNLTGLAGNNITGYSSFVASDINLKTNIKPLTEQTSNIDAIGIFNYNYKSDPFNKIHYGVIAQELEKLFPHLVLKDNNGHLNVNYVELIPILIKALQESNSEIKILKKQIFQQQLDNEELDNELNRLMTQQHIFSQKLELLNKAIHK